ncbi:UDP-N-acetylmuramoyl-L-alanyl-D-glutamate--2,6-diaminopimelate ligase [Planctomicrobium sp. SH664]|uniref:UDP-N-acetylmuramoyl-L-alanyl-D-glutamate--2, 6-diaminopimelate ligase n=1 Tax=Planctomicrobium sp. SH664 TaxID=3448125 RepID=UPI003F5B94D5
MFYPLRQPGSVSLRGLIPSASFVGCADITISSVTEHSHACTPGCLFAALPGTRLHGREFIEQARLSGAAAILTDRPLAEVTLPQCIVPDARQAYGRICHGLYAFPSQRLGVAGVTGTNGKTTTTWIVRSLLESASHPTGVIGTIEYNDGLESRPARLTTPDALPLAQSLAAMRDRHTTHAAIELSSHALKQGRTAGLSIDVGIITNITHDHLDYHGHLGDYIASKSLISQHIKRGGLLVLNADDRHHENILERLNVDVRVMTFGIDNEADVRAEIQSLSTNGSRFRLIHGTEQIDCFTPLVGQHNVSNCLAAACAGLHFRLSLAQIAAGLETCHLVPGRLERVNCGQPFQVYVDYAHTDDALRRVIAAVRQITTGRVSVVFGAGGERDHSKRPLMAKAASAADRVFVTSDNPRSEDPLEIIRQVVNGFAAEQQNYEIIPDRDAAIRSAIHAAQPGDAVIIAGKGHEKEQVVDGARLPFDDVAVCRSAILASFAGLQPCGGDSSHLPGKRL